MEKKEQRIVKGIYEMQQPDKLSRDSKAKINFLERNYLIRLNCCLYENASTNFLVLLFFPSVNTNGNTPNSASNPFTTSVLPRGMNIPHSETNNKINWNKKEK